MDTRIKIVIQLKHLYIGALLLLGIIAGKHVYGALSCSVSTVCTSPSVVLYRMSSTTNAHAELPSQSNYPNLVCCNGISGLGNACTGTFATVLNLSSTTNAHAEQNTLSHYSQQACIEAPAGGTVTVGYQSTNCSGYDTTIGSMVTTTNSHVGDGNSYLTKICGSATQPSLTFTIDSSSQNLNVTPGTPVTSTSVLSAQTTYVNGFLVTVQKQATTTLVLNSNPGIVISDKTEWIAPSATTSAGDSSASTTQPYSLQFRVKATGTDNPDLASTWWGSDDFASALFAGFPSTTQTIINRSVPATATTSASVLYDLNVNTSQYNGTYSGTVVYTATANP